MSDTPHIIRRGEIEIIQIDNAQCSAELSLFGGHVMHWQPSGQKPVLWMSKSAAFDGKTALRGGIPVCWPWFGAIEGKGRHGLVRTRLWQMEHYADTTEGTELTLSIELNEAENPWPHPNRLVMHLQFGEQLRQTLQMRNDSENPQCFAYALHNYFKVSNHEKVRIPVFANGIFNDNESGEKHLVDPGTESYKGPIDRTYVNENGASILDKKYARSIHIEKTGSQHWVLWNPGTAAAEQMADIHEGGEKKFICLETANTAAVVIPPGEEISISQSIRVADYPSD